MQVALPVLLPASQPWLLDLHPGTAKASPVGSLAAGINTIEVGFDHPYQQLMCFVNGTCVLCVVSSRLICV